MAKSIGARVNEDIYNWLDEKSQEEHTTMARIIEDLLIHEYKKDKEKPEDGSMALTEVPQLRDLDAEPIVEAPDLDVANAIRDAHGEYLSGDDDARLTDVRFASDVPEAVLRDARSKIVEALADDV